MAKILAAGDDGSFSDFKILIASTDGGLTWSKVTTAISDSGWSVTWSESLGLWLCGTDFASGTDQVQTSTDGDDGNWTAQTSPADSSGSVRRVISGPGQLVAAYRKSGTLNIMTSPDGITWTQQVLPTTIFTSGNGALAYSPDLGLYCLGEADFTPAPGVGGAMLTSPDAITWTSHDKDSTLTGDGNLAWGNGLFVLMSGPAGSGEHLQTSPDGVNWTTQADPGGIPQSWSYVSFGNGRFVAVSADISTSPGNQAAYSTDGINWTIVATPGSGKKWSAVAYDGTAWIACDGGFGSTQSLMRSTDDGATWSLITLGFSYGFMNGIASDFQPSPPVVTMGNIWAGGSGQGAGNHW